MKCVSISACFVACLPISAYAHPGHQSGDALAVIPALAGNAVYIPIALIVALGVIAGAIRLYRSRKPIASDD